MKKNALVDDELLASIMREPTHDLKSPLSIIVSCLDYLANSSPLTDTQRTSIKRAEDAAKRMNMLINQIMNFTWVFSDQPIEPKTVNLNKLIKNVVEFARHFAEPMNVTVYYEEDVTLGTIQADEIRIDQLMQNLLTNAIVHNRDGGVVSVETRSMPDSVTIIVRDNGPGIDAENVERYFKTFEHQRDIRKNRPKGMGVGLSIVKGVVMKHHGKLAVKSMQGEGTAFWVELPRFQEDINRDGTLVDEEYSSIVFGDEFPEDSKIIVTPMDSEEPADGVDDDTQERSNLDISDDDNYSYHIS